MGQGKVGLCFWLALSGRVASCARAGRLPLARPNRRLGRALPRTEAPRRRLTPAEVLHGRPDVRRLGSFGARAPNRKGGGRKERKGKEREGGADETHTSLRPRARAPAMPATPREGSRTALGLACPAPAFSRRARSPKGARAIGFRGRLFFMGASEHRLVLVLRLHTVPFCLPTFNVFVCRQRDGGKRGRCCGVPKWGAWLRGCVRESRESERRRLKKRERRRRRRRRAVQRRALGARPGVLPERTASSKRP